MIGKPNQNKFICTRCHATYSLNEPRWKCDCGSLLDIQFNFRFFPEKIQKRGLTLWRYREAIPVSFDKNIVSFQEGYTPLNKIPILKRPILFKLDYLFPTGSFKDRGASVLISKAREVGIKSVVEDSSGNAGASIAAYCAKAGIKCNIFVPASTSPTKMTQILSYGAFLKKIPGSRKDTEKAAQEKVEKQYYASHSWNPFFLQGTKTFSYEVCEQLGWKSPDAIILPVGNGTLLLGAYIGFLDLLKNKIIKKIPKLIAVQSENCAPLYRTYKYNLKDLPIVDIKKTIAEGIAVSSPVRWRQIINAIRHSKGDFILVTENEISNSMTEMSKNGYYIEPTSAVAVSGIKKYLKKTKRTATIVSTLTGHGLKTGTESEKYF